MENDDPNVIYVCFWCGEQFQVTDDVMVNFRVGIRQDGSEAYVPSCPKCAKPTKGGEEEAGYVH